MMKIRNRSSFVVRNGRSAALLLAAVLLATTALPRAAHAFELIPSIGMTKSTDAQAPDGKFFGGLALRTAVLPMLKVEAGISYRQDEIDATNIQIRQWPLTLSMWFTPTPYVYAGAGIGWYRTTLDFPDTIPIENSTTQKVGVHLGGGVSIPMTSRVGLDLSGRYIFLQADDTSPLLPTEFDPDFWSLGVGLAVSF